MYLKTGHTGNRAVRRPDLSRVIWECGQAITINGRHICKKRPGELHTISRISCKSDHHIMGINDFMLHSI